MIVNPLPPFLHCRKQLNIGLVNKPGTDTVRLTNLGALKLVAWPLAYTIGMLMCLRLIEEVEGLVARGCWVFSGFGQPPCPLEAYMKMNKLTSRILETHKIFKTFSSDIHQNKSGNRWGQFSLLVSSTLFNIELLIYEIKMTFLPNVWRMNITAQTWGLGVSPEAEDRPEVLRFWAESDCVSVSMEELGEMKPSSCVSAEVEVVDLPSVLCLLLRPSRLLPYKIHSIRSSVVKAAV